MKETAKEKNTPKYVYRFLIKHSNTDITFIEVMLIKTGFFFRKYVEKAHKNM